jgi:YD repeat-containing protein
MSPQASSLGTYGVYDINYYTGSPNISIPIYEIKDPGVTIPISLSYDATGFVPNSNSSQVGLNWSLAAGGVITRTVRGVPDEKRDPNFASSSLEDQYTKNHTGYIWGIQHNATSTYPPQTYIENLSFLSSTANTAVGFPQVTGSNVLYEYNPDLFSFNFLGHSGTFVMGNDGIVKVSSDRNYKVDLSGLTEQFNLGEKIRTEAFYGTINTNTNFSKITITSDDGYVFQFGGKFAALEISFNYPSKDYRSVDGKSGVISAWYLTKITTPDGNEVTFDYGTYSPADINVLKRIDLEVNGSWDTTKVDFLDIRLFTNDFKQEWNLYMGSGYNLGITTNKSLIKMAYLRSIMTKSKKVSFFYSAKNETSSNKFYTGTPYEGFIIHNSKYFSSKLDRVSIEDRIGIAGFADDDLVLLPPKLNYDLVYQYYGSQQSGYRLFLKEVNSDNIHYEIDYSNTSALPHPLTAGVDKWGFYNGQDGNQWLIGITNTVYGDPAEFETNFTVPGQVRTANAANADVGMIQKITYPTGGTTEFEFEAHRFNKILKRKVNASSGNSMIPEWVTLNAGENDVAGGCRIKKITTKSSSTEPALIKTYKYIKNYNSNPNGPSSGLLTDYGVFRIRYSRSGSEYHEQLYDQTIARSNGITAPYICYSQVVEILGAGNEGYTKYVFTNPDNQEFSEPVACPDNYYLGPGAIRIYATSPTVTSLENQMKRLARYSSRSTERGKLFTKEIYSQANNLVSSEEYEYNRDINRFNEKTVGYEKIYNQVYPDQTSYNGFSYFFNSFQLYNYHNNPTKITQKTFSNGQVLTQITSMTYKGNANPLLTEKIVTRSDGSINSTKYYYPEDRIGDPEYSFCQGMVNKYMVGVVVETQSYKDNTLLQTQKNIFTDINGTGAFKIQSTKTINHTITPLTTEQWMNLAYFTDGSVKNVQRWNDYKTAYIWDYKKTLAVAEVTNVSSASDISFTSFETDETWSGGEYAQWTYNTAARVLTRNCPTGTMTYDLNYNGVSQSITRILNPNVQYVLSLWFKGNNINVGSLSPVNQIVNGDWVYKEYAVTGLTSLSITGTGKVDELRLYPKGALMTTYTYQPLFGITSQCDPNNNITYFTYDNSGRLIIIRDKDRNVIKKYCYNYYLQPDNCGGSVIPLQYFNEVQSQAFTRNNCGSCAVGSQVTYTVPQNTYSSTVSVAAANQLALNDIAANGQNYANANGTCTANGVNITYSNLTSQSGYTATYTNMATSQVYTFTVPASGSGNLGCIPSGTYSLSITKSGVQIPSLFGTGCSTQSGTSASFWKVIVGPPSNCNVVSIEVDY